MSGDEKRIVWTSKREASRQWHLDQMAAIEIIDRDVVGEDGKPQVHAGRPCHKSDLTRVTLRCLCCVSVIHWAMLTQNSGDGQAFST